MTSCYFLINGYFLTNGFTLLFMTCDYTVYYTVLSSDSSKNSFSLIIYKYIKKYNLKKITIPYPLHHHHFTMKRNHILIFNPKFHK